MVCSPFKRKTQVDDSHVISRPLMTSRMQTAYGAFSFIHSKANIPPVERERERCSVTVPRINCLTRRPPTVLRGGGARKKGGYRGAAAALFHRSRQRGLLKSDPKWLGCADKIKYRSRFGECAACFITRSIILDLLCGSSGAAASCT